MLNTVQFPFKLADGVGRGYKESEKKEKLMMNAAEWERNVAKTSRASEGSVQEGK